MKLTDEQVDEIESTLWDGSAEEMRALSSLGFTVSYTFTPSAGSLTIRIGQEGEPGSRMLRCHGTHDVPNCAKLFGNSHTF